MYNDSKYWPYLVLFFSGIIVFFFISKSLEQPCLVPNNNIKSYYFNGTIKSIDETTSNSGAERIEIIGTGLKYFYWQEESLMDKKILPIAETGYSIFKEKGQTFLLIIKTDSTYKIDLLLPCK